MAIILPQEGSIWQTLGTGLGSGLQALAKGKIKQLENRNYAGALKEMGFDPEIAYLSEKLQPLAIQLQQKQMENAKRLEQLGEQSRRLKNIYGIDVSPEFLATKEGQKYANQLVESEIRQYEQEHKQFIKPTTTGEALLRAVSFGGKGNRTKPRLSPVERERAYSELQQIQSLSSEQKQQMTDLGFDVDAYENQLINTVSSEGTGGPTAEGSSFNSSSQPMSGLQALASTGIGGLKGLAAINPLFLPQNLTSLGLSGINALGNLLGAENNIVPNYEELRQSAGEVSPEQKQAIEKGRQSGSFLDKIAGASLSQPAFSGLLPTSEELAQNLQGLTEGTSLEKYAIPQSEVQQNFEDLGALIPALFNGKAAEGIIGKTKEAAKATAKAYGAKVAGQFAKEITGSDLLGKGVTFGTVLAMNIFPGTFAQNARREYQAFEDGVIKPAEAAGKRVPLDAQFNDAITKWEKQAIKGWARGTAEHKALSDEINLLQDLEARKGSIDPSALWNNIKRSNRIYNKIPKNAREDFSKLIDIQKNLLNRFGDSINPQATAALQKGNDIYQAMYANKKIAKNIQDQTGLRNLGYGTLAWMLGRNMPYVLGGALALKGGSYLNKLMSVPSIRQTTYDLFKASASRNVGAISALSKKLDRQIKKEQPEYYREMNALYK